MVIELELKDGTYRGTYYGKDVPVAQSPFDIPGSPQQYLADHEALERERSERAAPECNAQSESDNPLWGTW